MKPWLSNLKDRPTYYIANFCPFRVKDMIILVLELAALGPLNKYLKKHTQVTTTEDASRHVFAFAA